MIGIYRLPHSFDTKKVHENLQKHSSSLQILFEQWPTSQRGVHHVTNALRVLQADVRDQFLQS